MIADNTYDGPNTGDWTYFLVRGASDIQNTIFARNDGYILQEGGSLEYSVVFGDSVACQGCTWDTNLDADPKLTADYAIDLGSSPGADAGNPARRSVRHRGGHSVAALRAWIHHRKRQM